MKKLDRLAMIDLTSLYGLKARAAGEKEGTRVWVGGRKIGAVRVVGLLSRSHIGWRGQ